MPKSGQTPDQQDVSDPAQFPCAVSAQGNVDIIPKPSAQTDVPPPPEFGDRVGAIGIPKVFRKVKAQNPPQAYGHVTVTGEIEIDLQEEAHGGQPCKEHRGL